MITSYLRYKQGTELVRLPLLSVHLACNRKRETIWTIIDSGADVSVFSGEIADLLDIKPETGRPFNLGGILDGSEMKSWLHQVNLTVDDLGSIDIMVAFTASASPVLSILGQKGFFDSYQIRFQRFKDQIEIWPKSGTA